VGPTAAVRLVGCCAAGAAAGLQRSEKQLRRGAATQPPACTGSSTQSQLGVKGTLNSLAYGGTKQVAGCARRHLHYEGSN
jgi:hypothetical protein